ncbi:hypothetical protein [Teredinibacter sp. KSP-S5-2]|uniref:hypothetical protein n=1 Tax=Teredinibacter sp. KSP-S5-2 TaxID=3034506 RepID=UPI002934ABC1|nr:hypothetical protein [Teredinibacter sp. KSP-S5-2]WNO10434.1 hypothetical protein P5V12_04545 [Teredinibacter sp. KSP-S5-2]
MLTSILNALVELLSSIVGVGYVGLAPKKKTSLNLPALVVELVELEPDADPGTGELALRAHWEARVVTLESQPEPQSWELVSAVLFELFQAPWMLENVGLVQIKSVARDYFSPEFQGHRIWLIEWVQPLRLGENKWDTEGIVPQSIFVYPLGDETGELISEEN